MAQPESTKHENTKPKIIEERLGRSSITVTMDTYGHLRTPTDTYGHLTPTMQTDAVQNFADLLKQAREEWSLESVG
jgi:hypothetical protein